jgi:predicted nucleotidyltransferase
VEQNLSLEIVDAILSGEAHARGLAKKLNTNHMTVSRKLAQLVEENALDFRIEGRNKVYSLKRGAEARGYVLMSELHKLNRALKRYPELRNITEKIQGNARVKLAVLFGSYAKGTAARGSDIDLFVETSDSALKRELELLNSRLSVKIGTYDGTSLLAKEIEKNHVILKGAELFHEKASILC